MVILTYLYFSQSGYTLGVMHVGAPACGMNAAVRSFVRNCIYRGDTVVGIHDGVEGLIEGNVSCNDFSSYRQVSRRSLQQVQPLGWSDVTGWVGQGGAFLGTKRTLPEGKFPEVAASLRKHNIQALLLIGGFEVP